ncbi:hypothetical protein VQL36_19180 [Chengkuizengella sp. SCS-71B]
MKNELIIEVNIRFYIYIINEGYLRLLKAVKSFVIEKLSKVMQVD